MNLLDVYKELNTEDKCLAFLEKMRWPGGLKCLSCESSRITRITSKGKTNKKSGKTSPDRKLWQCNECRFQFTATTGTVYHDTHLPLHKWFLAIALITESKKGISANQLKRALSVQYRTAWYLAHRIRKAMEEKDPPKMKGIVEVDETYIGGKQHTYSKAGYGDSNKEIVIGIRQRGGDLRFFHAQDVKSTTLAQFIRENVSEDVDAIMTDELNAYPTAMKSLSMTAKHKTIKHKAKVYVDGDIHTNTVESEFSLFKRGLNGAFHKVSLKHLQRYLDEFSFRFNNRKDPDLFGMTIARMAKIGAMPYIKLVEENAFTAFVKP